MKKSIKRNYIYNLLYQFLLIFLPIITTPYISRILGAEGNGIYGYTLSIVNYFIIFGSLGIVLYGQREIAYVQNNIEKRSQIFFELFLLRIITMFISTILFYTIFVRSGEYCLYYKILLLEMLASALDISWFFFGLEDFKKITIRNFIIKIVTLFLIFILVRDYSDVDKYIFIHSFSTLIGSLILWLGIKKYIILPKIINLSKHILPMIILFIPQIAIQIYTLLDKTMIGIITDSMSEVGYYEQAQKIIKILLTIITSLSTVMLPRMSKYFAEKNFKMINNYMKKTFSFIYMTSLPLTLGIMVVANNFVPLFFGDGYDKVVNLMIILSPIIIFISISGAIGNQFLLSTKRQKEYTISVVSGAIINFLLNILLIIKFNSFGAAISTLIAEFIVTLIQMKFVKKEIDIKESILSAKKYLLASIIMFIFCVLIDILVLNNLICLILQVLFGVIIYFISLFIMKDEFFLSFCKNKIYRR